MDMPIAKRLFSNTRAALDVFRSTEKEREAAWNRVETNADVEACQAADRAALEKVQDAFHLDTKDINSLDHCRRADLTFMIRCSEWELPK